MGEKAVKICDWPFKGHFWCLLCSSAVVCRCQRTKVNHPITEPAHHHFSGIALTHSILTNGFSLSFTTYDSVFRPLCCLLSRLCSWTVCSWVTQCFCQKVLSGQRGSPRLQQLFPSQKTFLRRGGGLKVFFSPLTSFLTLPQQRSFGNGEVKCLLSFLGTHTNISNQTMLSFHFLQWFVFVYVSSKEKMHFTSQLWLGET